jgi:preprotein translocase subunit SecE
MNCTGILMSANANTTPASSGADTAILLLSVAVLIGSIFAYYYFIDLSVVIRALMIVAGVIGSVFLVGQSQKGKRAFEYIRGSRTEVRRVVWPTRQEAVQTTIIVVVFVFIFGLMLWGLDAVLARVVQAALGRG